MFPAQNIDENVDKKGLIENEMNSFNVKMTAGSVNPNTLNYDLQYQRMNVTINPAVNFISGSVTSHFKPTSTMNSIYFDLNNNLSVSQVTYHNQNLTFQQLATKELKIDFTTALSPNVLDSLTIHYSGNPDPSNNSFFNGTQGGVAVLSTLNEPYGAQDWFPTKQSLNDKIEKFDIKITTPQQYSVAANGKLMSESLVGNGQKLTFWRTQYPVAAYLVALSITNFVKLNDTIGNPPFPFINYIYPSTNNNSSSMSNINWTKTVMNTFEDYFGPYPFRNEKYGHMEFSRGGGMEHQTMSSMGGWSKQLIAHELAHQWFGDKVTCSTWNDIWLNEGFATFGEHLAYEKLIMNHSEFMNYLSNEKNYITSVSGGSVFVNNGNLGNIYAIFDSRLTYSKAGFVVRMMKWILGDTVFYQALKDYHNKPNLSYSYASTEDLKNSFLTSTGVDFTEFFNDWIYGQGYPTYNIRWKQIGNDVVFNINQTQSHSSVSFFEMPLPIKIIGTGGQTLEFTLNNTTNNQYFIQTVGFPIQTVIFNYEHQMIEKNSTVLQDNSLSVKEISKEDLLIFPNPVEDILYIKGIKKDFYFELYSIDGKLLQTGNYNKEKGIDVKTLLKGTYIITINRQNFKFIKK